MEAREYLEEVGKINKLIENKLVEQMQWQSIAEGMSAKVAGERVQSSPTQHKMEDAAIRVVDIERDIDLLIQRLIDRQQDIINTLEQLEATSYDVLHKIYVQGLQVQEIAAMYHTTMRSINRKKGKALKQVQVILNDREKKAKG